MKFAASVTAAVLAALSFAAHAATPEQMLAEVKNQAVFCEGTYALCIKAPCVPTPTLDRLGNYYIDHVACSCDVEQGWSMGPGQCADRGPVTQNGRTFLISTYSNRFNVRNKTLNNTLRCMGQDTLWAWCYGAPCVIDAHDPNKATCTCPVETGPMQTLGGDCSQDKCTNIYSAATIAGDAYANNHFAEYMAQHNYPHEPAAQLCPGSPPLLPPK